jgi:exodeoxyribonuclease V alpha subunit
MSKKEQLTGTVGKLKCQKAGFSAGFLLVDDESVSFSVKAYVKSGDTVTIDGNWQTHPKYGPQFKGTAAHLSMPTTPAGLVKWLEWHVTGVGPVTAERLVDEYGVALMDRCADDADGVAQFAKLAKVNIEDMARRWKEEGQRVGAMTYLAGLGLTQRQCESLLDTFGGGVVRLVQDEPYHLIGRCDGFGWSVTDDLANQVGIRGGDPRRLRGALRAIVQEASDKGSTCVQVGEAVRDAAKKLGLHDPAGAAAIIAQAVSDDQLRRFGAGTDETDYLASPYTYMQEEYVWRELQRFSGEANPFGTADDDKARELAEGYRTLDGITFDDGQLEALYRAIRWRVSVITGGAGCGKTSLARAIVQYFSDGDVPVRLACPTGKAARRLQEATGQEAETIHRLLEYHGGEGTFRRNRTEPLTNCVVILDETSMCDVPLLYHVVAAMGRNTALVMIGDPNQLPPVGPGSPLRDILEHRLAPATRLEHCHRQAGHLKTNCSALLQGTVAPTVMSETPFPWIVETRPDTPEKMMLLIRHLYSDYLPRWGFDPVTETQFMTARHKGWYGTEWLNLVLQHLHQTSLGNAIDPPEEEDVHKRPLLYAGDKVVIDKNDYDLNVFNGEIGTVRVVAPTIQTSEENPFAVTTNVYESGAAPKNRPDQKEKKPKAPVADYVLHLGDRAVTIPLGQGGMVSLAYCLTVHRMQGSQTPCAVFVCPLAHAFMQNRSLIYTATTRARRTALVIGNGAHAAARKENTDRRETITRVFANFEAARPVALPPVVQSPRPVPESRVPSLPDYAARPTESFPRLAVFLVAAAQRIRNGMAVTFEVADELLAITPATSPQYRGSFVVRAGTLMGRIQSDGAWFPAPDPEEPYDAVLDTLRAFDADPHGHANAYGRKHERCCLCGTGLSADESAVAGYHPACAKNYALPYKKPKATLGKKKQTPSVPTNVVSGWWQDPEDFE